MSFHIGIAGPLASGKSSLARAIKADLETRGYSVTIIPLAQAIKELAARLNGDPVHDYLEALATIDYDYGYTDVDAIERSVAAIVEAYQKYYTPNEKPRKLLQTIGTEIGREMIDEDIWIKRVNARKLESGVDIIITDDIRFNNEALAVDFLISIRTDSALAQAAYQRNKTKFSEQYLDTNHASENGLTIKSDAEVSCGFRENGITELMERIYAWLPV